MEISILGRKRNLTAEGEDDIFDGMSQIKDSESDKYDIVIQFVFDYI